MVCLQPCGQILATRLLIEGRTITEAMASSMTPCLDLLRRRAASSCTLPAGGRQPALQQSTETEPQQGAREDRGYGPLRAGAPGRLPYRRGSFPDLSHPVAKQRAVADYELGFYAASSAPAIAARRRLYHKILLQWGFDFEHLGPEVVHAVGATLRAGGYRSSDCILSQMSVDAERAGIEISPATRRALTDAARSCRRGLGPPLRAMALNFALFERLPGDPTPWAPGGPASPRNALITAGWWMLREVEVANLRASCVTITPGRCPAVALTLPTSKADQAGAGVQRTHTCICQGGAIRPFCPAHAAWDQMICLRRWFPDRFADDAASADLPFFPTSAGSPCTKEGFTRTISQAAVLLDLPQQSAVDNERVTGHSMRATGAQFLARAGLDTYTVQLLGRWGSSAVERYVREAVISGAASRARASQLAQTLTHMSGEVVAALPRDQFDRSFVQSCIRESFVSERGLTDEIADALVERVTARVQSHVLRRTAGAAAQPSTPQSSSSSSSSSASPGGDGPAGTPPAGITERVANDHYKKVHLVVHGPPSLEIGMWVTQCGWRFGRSSVARRPEESDLLCSRCFRHKLG